MQNIAFTPGRLIVRRGQRVTWRWLDREVTHNVTSVGSERFHNSGDRFTGAAFTVRFTHTGTYRYICTLHAMHGEIIVR